MIKYHLVKTKMTWLNALQYCRTYFTDLVSITNVIENGLVLSVIVTNMEWEAWIGLSRNVWLWSDGTDASHPAMTWIDTQPDNLDGSESCGYVRADGAMGDDVCSIPRPFFCSEMSRFSFPASDEMSDHERCVCSLKSLYCFCFLHKPK